MTNIVLISTEDNATDKVILEIQRPTLTITTGIQGPAGTSPVWGNITGILSNQTDLQLALDDLTPNSLILSNTVWEGLRFPVQGINPVGSVAPPSVDTADGTLVFSASQTNIIAGIAQLPRGWKEGSTIDPHVHWSPSNTSTGNVLWRFEYEVQNINGVFTGSTIVDTLGAGSGVAEAYQVHSLGTIDMTGKNINCIMKWKLSRIGVDGTDTFTGTARLLEFEIHYEVDSLGSSTESTK
jgi:hypothetical protein